LWIAPGTLSSKEEAARMHGKLMHLATIYLLIRPFLRSISRFAAQFTSCHARLEVPSATQSNIRWLIDIVPLLPRNLPLSLPEPVNI
jgi:hypothetical protein